MINQVSKIINTSQRFDSSNITFNTNLPMSITVLEKLYTNQYKLLLGRKELMAKSKNKLNVKKKYWGILKENKENILHISNLIQKPEIFNTDMEFLDIESKFFFKLLTEDKNPIKTIKKKIIDKMADTATTKEQFLTLSQILLAQSEGIFHFPVIIEDRKVLLQFNIHNDSSTYFYLALENLGPISGKMTLDNNIPTLELGVLFEKSYDLLKKELENNTINTYISLKSEILPLFDSSEVLLDMKG
ncbi:MAG: hypothetical protein R3331_10210 [Sulfurospirillaceae bacterium]|nr:hypothetical protein [Sulfurospirillaceae bacterium]